MKKFNRDKFYFVLSILFCLIPISMGFCFYDIMPNKMPIHFGYDNIADNYASKNIVLFFMPIMFILLLIFTVFMLKKDPKNYNQSKGMLYILYLFIPLMSIFTSGMAISYCLGYRPNISLYLIRIIAVFFFGIGNLLPKTKRNYTMGIKVPWTLDSDEIWNKTHRLAGYLWCILSLLLLISSYVFEKMINEIFFVILLIIIFVPIIYSYRLYKKTNK